MEFTEGDWTLAERYEGLREACRGIDVVGVGAFYHDHCCQNRGYVPNVTTDGLLDVLERENGGVEYWFCAEEYVPDAHTSFPATYRTVSCDGYDGEIETWHEFPTRLDALKAAVMAMEVEG